ncbi:MAG: helix-turn-helix domain-containing protein, partial [Xenococcaceae cyanobacterium]
MIAPGEVNDFSGLGTTWNWIVIFEADAIVPCLTDTDIFGLLPHEFVLLSFLQIKNGEIRCFNIAPVDIPRWLTRLQQIEREIHHKPTSLTETARTLLIQLLIDTVRLIAPQLSKNPLHSHPLLSSVFDFIQQNYNRQISLCDVAKAVERSSAYLTDLVRRKTGRTVLNWIIEYRMAAARRLLLRTTCSVESISQDLGYLDKSHFLRQFR